MMNPMQLMQMIRNGGNPQQAIINIMKNQSGNSPVINNAINMMKKATVQVLKNLQETFAKKKELILMICYRRLRTSSE